ncbi:DUF3305 domain-containing protein [Roseivivax sp. CAU 1761]
MQLAERKSVTMPMGVIVRRSPGVTRWAKWVWRPVALLPNAGPAEWKLLREDSDGSAEFHAGTVPLTLWRGEAEAYRTALSETPPCCYAVLRPAPGAAVPWRLHMVTASPHEAALFAQSGDEIVEKLAMPQDLIGWVAAWTATHYVEEPFVKRKRQKHRDGAPGEGRGDPRIAPADDVFRAPTARRHSEDGPEDGA